MLENTIYRLKKEKKLRVGYFGGSITEGAGATEWDRTSWRARLTAHLRESYPDAEITEIAAAVGGTGTDLGLCRCGHDLLSGDPDLVFIEFATNDSNFTFADQLSGYENCLRQILGYKDTVEVVCVFSATQSTERLILTTGDFSSRSVEAMLAHYYGLPTADPGDALRIAVKETGGDWLRYTTDCTHPNDDGYLIYTDVMTKAVDGWLSAQTPEALTHRALPAPICREPLHPGKLIDLCECPELLGDFTFVDRRFKRRFPHYYVANGVGSELTFTFDGAGFGLYMILDNESGIVEVTLDGGETREICLWVEYCKSFSRGGYEFAFRDLPRGKHSVKLRVSEKKHPESMGTKVAIFGFLIL